MWELVSALISKVMTSVLINMRVIEFNRGYRLSVTPIKLNSLTKNKEGKTMTDTTKYKYVVDYKGSYKEYHVERITCSKEALQFELRQIFLGIEEINGTVLYYNIAII